MQPIHIAFPSTNNTVCGHAFVPTVNPRLFWFLHRPARIVLPGWIALLLLLNGCSTTHDARGIDWNSRIGNYTFEDMVDDYGPPLSETKGDDGSRMGEWVVLRDQNWDLKLHTYDSRPVAEIAHSAEPRSELGYVYKMKFDPHGRLENWKKAQP